MTTPTIGHSFLKDTVIDRTALGLLQRDIMLPRLVWTYGAENFRGAQDDTVTLRVPARLDAREYEWRTRSAPIVMDTLTEQAIPVTLDKHPYSAVAVTDEQLTLDITSFGAQVLAPQTRALGEALENYIAAQLASAPFATTLEYYAEEPATTPTGPYTSDAYVMALRARQALNKEHVPMSGRVLVLGADVETSVLQSDRLVPYDQSGSDSALRDASIGRLAGFDVITSYSIAPDVAYALHNTAVVFANMAPAVPDGVSYGSSQSYEGLALRWIRDYDPNYLLDRSVLSSFAGTASVDDGVDAGGTLNGTNVRGVKINYTPPA